jgi:hypothetical protein
MGQDPVSDGIEKRVGREIEGGGSADAVRGKAEMCLAGEQLEQYKARLVWPSGRRM